MDRIEGLRAEIDPAEFDPLNIRENLKKLIDIENIRNRGFNTAMNSITSILDTSKMGYQYLENLKNAREMILQEYEDTDPANLPDERYQIRMKYYDNAQLIEERRSYSRDGVRRFEVHEGCHGLPRSCQEQEEQNPKENQSSDGRSAVRGY